MSYRVLADAVLLLHAAFVLFVVFGAVLVAWRGWIVWLHVPTVAWGAWIELVGGLCPLTPLENRLRVLAGEAGYPGGFIEHYVFGALYPEGLTRNIQIALGVGALAVNVVAYAWVWRRRRASQARPPALPR